MDAVARCSRKISQSGSGSAYCPQFKHPHPSTTKVCSTIYHCFAQFVQYLFSAKHPCVVVQKHLCIHRSIDTVVGEEEEEEEEEEEGVKSTPKEEEEVVSGEW